MSTVNLKFLFGFTIRTLYKTWLTIGIIKAYRHFLNTPQQAIILMTILHSHLHTFICFKFQNIQKYKQWLQFLKFWHFHNGNAILSNIKTQANHSSFKSDKLHDSLGTFHVASVAFKVSKTKAPILAFKHQAKSWNSHKVPLNLVTLHFINKVIHKPSFKGIHKNYKNVKCFFIIKLEIFQNSKFSFGLNFGGLCLQSLESHSKA